MFSSDNAIQMSRSYVHSNRENSVFIYILETNWLCLLSSGSQQKIDHSKKVNKIFKIAIDF